jgi:hypothetical protein
MIFNMGKGKKKTGAEKPQKVVKTDKGLSPEKISTNPSVEESAEYGGIPMRDLKKNLGCG